TAARRPRHRHDRRGRGCAPRWRDVGGRTAIGPTISLRRTAPIARRRARSPGRVIAVFSDGWSLTRSDAGAPMRGAPDGGAAADAKAMPSSDHPGRVAQWESSGLKPPRTAVRFRPRPLLDAEGGAAAALVRTPPHAGGANAGCTGVLARARATATGSGPGPGARDRLFGAARTAQPDPAGARTPSRGGAAVRPGLSLDVAGRGARRARHRPGRASRV